MTSFKNIFSIALITFVTSSCSVYYTTSQVDTNLKTSLNQANTSLNNLESQVNTLEGKYKDIHCDTKPAAMQQSDKMYAEIQHDLGQLSKDRSELNQEYSNFQNYTQGKDKIVSGTPEFQKLKETREHMKTKMENLQKSGENLVKKAQGFSDYISKNVVPQIQMVDVAQYKAKFDESLKGLNASQSHFESDLQRYEIQVNQYISLNSSSKAQNCSSLKSDMEKIHASIQNLNGIKANLQTTYNDFNTQTAGMKTISSCSNQWPLVAAVESSIASNQNKLNAIQAEIQSTANHIQSLVQ